MGGCTKGAARSKRALARPVFRWKEISMHRLALAVATAALLAAIPVAFIRFPNHDDASQ